MQQVKYFVVRAIRDYIAKIVERGALPNLSSDYKVTFVGSFGGSFQIKVYDPHKGAPRYFEIKVIEKM